MFIPSAFMREGLLELYKICCVNSDSETVSRQPLYHRMRIISYLVASSSHGLLCHDIAEFTYVYIFKSVSRELEPRPNSDLNSFPLFVLVFDPMSLYRRHCHAG